MVRTAIPKPHDLGFCFFPEGFFAPALTDLLCSGLIVALQTDTASPAAKISLEEQQARVNQAKTALAQSQTDYPILKSRYETALKEVDRYRKAWEDGAISEVQFIEREDNAKERQQLYERGKAEVKENQHKLAELESAYRQTSQQTSADIAQARLQLQERQRGLFYF